jgi:trk system potassium uptake protein TrkA
VQFQEQALCRIAWIDRLGEGILPSRESVLQEGDLLHIVMREEKANGVYDVLKKGPEDD